MTIEMGDMGTHLGNRFAGAALREVIKMNFNEADKFVFDFAGVETVSPSFADEGFAKLLLQFTYETIRQKITFRNATPMIKGVITTALNERRFVLAK